MPTNKSHDEAVDDIAIAIDELAATAACLGEKSLAYILRMAEIEARRSIGSGPAPEKRAVRPAKAVNGHSEHAHMRA